MNKYNLNINLFVLNTGGNHIPLKRQYIFQKKIMEKRFPFQNFYELYKKSKKFFIYDTKFFLNILKILVTFCIIKIYKIFFLIIYYFL